LIDKAALRQAVPERGRFRSFLLASFEHFLANLHARIGQRPQAASLYLEFLPNFGPATTTRKERHLHEAPGGSGTESLEQIFRERCLPTSAWRGTASTAPV
jgi:hypothetical protein